PELPLAFQPLLERQPVAGVVDADVLEHDASLVPLVKAADVGLPAGAGDHHRHAMEFLPVGMKDVTRHVQAVAPQYFSNACARLSAMTWGLRPSIWWRWTKCT